MSSLSARLLSLIVCAVTALALGLCAPALSFASVSVSSNYGSSIYIDAGSTNPTMQGAYVGYKVTTTTAESDVWVTIGAFTGGVVTAAPQAATRVHVGALPANGSTTVYFYVQASAATSTVQTHTITVYNGEPGAGGAVLTSATEPITVGDTQQASANKVDSVSVSTNAPTLGGTFTITVNGHTGTMATNPTFFLSPEADVNFPASAFQLVKTTIAFNEAGCPSATYNCATLTDQLAIPASSLPDPGDSPYVATYTFRAIGTTTTTTSLSPVVYITSGNLIKHTTPTSLSGLAPINPVANTTTLAVASSPQAVNATARTVTLTATATNSGATMNLDDFVATLPSGATYVAGSSTWGGAPVGDPNLSGQTATWAGVWNVPANGSNALSFQVALPATTGAYTTSVIAHAGGGQVDSTTGTSDNVPATFTDDVYATAPTVTFAGTPAADSNTSAPTFTFSASAPSTYTCSLDGGVYAPCSSPDALSGLADGQHTFSVRATDSVGNVSTPVSYTWTIDTTPPSVIITSGPNPVTNASGATFAFTADPGTVACQLDSGPWTSCTSPAGYTGLADGSHTFTVRDTDAAGNTASASSTWTIDTRTPTVTFTGTPGSPSPDTSGTIGLQASVSGSTFICRLDGAPSTSCTSAFAYTALADGSHSLQVIATSPAGNHGQATFTWTVDTSAPDVTITSAPSGSSTATSATVDFASSDPTATFSCQLDTGPWSPCQSPDALAGLDPGPHTFRVRATDPTGNVSSPASASWTVTSPPVTSPPPTPANVVSVGTGTDVQQRQLTAPSGGAITLLDSSGHPTDTVTVASQGTYTLDPVSGVVTFAPQLGFTGTAAPVTYQVSDAFGQTATAQYTPTVAAPAPPSAPALASAGSVGQTQTEAVNVPAGGSIALIDGTATVDRITIPGQGTYVLDAVAGVIRFMPLANFTGHVARITYRVIDAYGQSVVATYQAVVRAAPARPAPRALAHAPARVVLVSATTSVPVRCSVTGGRATTCSVSLRAVQTGGREVPVGSGQTTVPTAAASITVPVRLTALGRLLAARVGGVRLQAHAIVHSAGQALRARAATLAVAATVHVPTVYLFAADSSALSRSVSEALRHLRGQLAGVRAITCTGINDVAPTQDGSDDERGLGRARAQALCHALTLGRRMASTIAALPGRGPDQDSLAAIPGGEITLRY